MSSVAVIAAGSFPRKAYPRYLAGTADRVVVCDGALEAWLKAFPGREPDAVVGDMDSIPQALAKRFAHILHPESEQETNDLSKAIRYILSNIPDASEIHIIGGTGKREDHTVGNLSLLMEYASLYGLSGLSEVSLDLVSDTCTAFAVTDTCSLAVGEGRSISLFSPDNSLKITSEGLVWPTDGVVFDNWWKATLNKASADVVKLTFSHPSRALIILS